MRQLAGRELSSAKAPIVRTTMAEIRCALGTAPAQRTLVVTTELRTVLGMTPADTLTRLHDPIFR